MSGDTREMVIAQESTREAHAPGSSPGRLAAALAIGLLTSCTTVTGPLFPPQERDLVWPPPPDEPRIRYVGSISTTSDLNKRTKSFLGIAEIFLGEGEIDGLAGPRSVALTAGERYLWAADPGRRCVHVFDLVQREHHRIESVAGTRFQSPVGLCAAPEGGVFVCDSAAPAMFLLRGLRAEDHVRLSSPGVLRRPVAAVYHAATDDLFVVDAAAHDLKVMDRSGTLKRVIGRRGPEPGQFNFPCSIALHASTLWVADAGNYRVQGLTLRGMPLAAFGKPGDSPGHLALPKGIATDSAGHIYVVDARFENVQIFDQSGRLLLVFGEEGRGKGQFWLPSGIFVSATDRVWVCDSYNKRVQVFQYLEEGAVPGEAGKPPALPRLKTHEGAPR